LVNALGETKTYSKPNQPARYVRHLGDALYHVFPKGKERRDSFILDTRGIFNLPDGYGPGLGPRFREEMVPVRSSAGEGYANRRGKVVIELRFERAYPFSEGLAMVRVDGRIGYINPSGKMVFKLPPKAISARAFRGGLARVTDGRNAWYVKPNGERAFSEEFPAVGTGEFFEGVAAAKDEWTGLYGYIDKSGKFVIPPRYSNAEDFSEGLAEIKTAGGADGFIDHAGKTVMTFKRAVKGVADFQNGLAWVSKSGNPESIIVSNNYKDVADAWEKGFYVNRDGEKVWSTSD
jgi:hypothetical protein